jgi:acetyl-CoA acetyltransferase
MSRDEKDLVIVAGWRTPFCKASGALSGSSAADLATHVFRETIDRTGIDPRVIDEVILGCAGPDAAEANVARVAALRAGLPKETPAVTVMRNCASGMEALLAAQQRLRAGDGEVFNAFDLAVQYRFDGNRNAAMRSREVQYVAASSSLSNPGSGSSYFDLSTRYAVSSAVAPVTTSIGTPRLSRSFLSRSNVRRNESWSAL